MSAPILVVQHETDCPPGWVGEWLAENAVGLLLERISGNAEAARRDLSVPYTLEIRESTAG